MMVVDDLGEPLVVEDPAHRRRLGHVVHEPVPVVVVPDVVVVELGRPGGLEGGLEVPAVPGRDDVESVGVHGGHEDENHLVADLPRLLRFLGGDAVGEERHHLRRRHLGGMQSGVNPDDRLAFAGQAYRLLFRNLGVGQRAGIRPVPVQLREVLR